MNIVFLDAGSSLMPTEAQRIDTKILKDDVHKVRELLPKGVHVYLYMYLYVYIYVSIYYI